MDAQRGTRNAPPAHNACGEVVLHNRSSHTRCRFRNRRQTKSSIKFYKPLSISIFFCLVCGQRASVMHFHYISISYGALRVCATPVANIEPQLAVP